MQALRQFLGRIEVQTHGAGFIDVTAEIGIWLTNQRISTGLLTLYCRHTSASLTIQENADPSVLADLGTALERLAPRAGAYLHDAEGPDDMPAHIKTMLTSVSLSIPVMDGRMVLGVWQAIYLIEHRSRPHRRDLVVHVVGE
jgi:secondary thiamine-phosphate synthase enzyme